MPTLPKPQPLDPKIDLWLRQPGESEPAWKAFTIFRGLGPDRTMGQCAAAVGRHPNQAYRWAAAWSWKHRASAYDRHMDAAEIAVEQRERVKMKKRHAAIAAKAIDVLALPIDELARRIEEKKATLKTMPLRELLPLARASASALKDLAGLERVSRDVPSDVNGVVVGVGGVPKTVADAVAEMFASANPELPAHEGAVDGDDADIIEGEIVD